jgi:hypothetical protein
LQSQNSLLGYPLKPDFLLCSHIESGDITK